MKKCKSAFLILGFLLYFSFDVQAQRRKEFTGNLTTSEGNVGEARFQYIERKDDRILDGDYKITFRPGDSLRNQIFRKTDWSGTYKEDKKNDKWVYQEYEHYVFIDDIVDSQTKTTLRSNVRELQASYEDGVPVDNWRFTEKQYEPNKPAIIITKGELPFVAGVVNGRISLEAIDNNDQINIEGYVNQLGHMDSLWVFNYTLDSVPIKETRRYNDGLLIYAKTEDPADNKILEEYEWADVISAMHGDEEWVVGKSSKIFGLTFDNGYAPYGRELTMQFEGNQFLFAILDKMLSLDTAFQLQQEMPLGTSRLVYRLTEENKKDIERSDALLDTISFMIKEISKNTSLSINSQRTDSLAWTSIYYRQYPAQLNRLKGTLKFMKSDDFRYVNPNIYFTQNAVYLRPEQSIKYDFNGNRTEKIISFSPAEVKSLREFRLRLENESQILATLSRTIHHELDRILKSNKLQVVENMILSSRLILDTLYLYNTDESLPVANNVLQALHSTFAENHYNELLKNYSNSQNFDEKDSLAYRIVGFLDVLEEIPLEIIQLFKTHAKIDEAYTEIKMDPYTFNYNFKTRRKKKIYEKVAEELFTYRIEALKQETDYLKLNDHIEAIQFLQKRLFELLKEDTVQLERSIKKNDTPLQIEKLIST